jgi:hypothetical protein
MFRWPFSALLVGTALSAAMPVLADTCYEVRDRNDAVIFRGMQTPVDLSLAGVPAREAMRRRGELLIIYDADTCFVVRQDSATSGKAFTAEEIVASWRSSYSAGNLERWGRRNE